MRWTLIALAAALAASTTPAAACGFSSCYGEALADDSYPLGQPQLPPQLAAIVAARNGKGASGLIAFYNDPGRAFAATSYAPPQYGYAPQPEPGYVEAPPVVYGAPVGAGYYPGYGVHRPYYGAHPYARHAVRQGGAHDYGRPRVY